LGRVAGSYLCLAAMLAALRAPHCRPAAAAPSSAAAAAQAASNAAGAALTACCRGFATAPQEASSVSSAARPPSAPPGAAEDGQQQRPKEPSAHVQRLVDKLIALSPQELALVRKGCRDRLTPLPSFHRGPPPKNYKPKMLARRREDAPLPLRGKLADLGVRFSGIHPAYIFAGGGPGVLNMPMPALGPAIMAPHYAEMAGNVDPAAMAGATAFAAPAAAAPAATAEGDDAAEDAPVEEKKVEAVVLKANLTIRLLGFDASKKINVIKEVRAMLGEGLKESKDKVEGAPCLLKKGVPRAEAEAQAEKLRAAGAEIALE